MNREGEIKVSICCATYNHKPYLKRCLEGFLMQQTSFAFEILIHDDASTDGTTDIVRAYAAAYPDLIHPVIQTINQYSTNTRAMITTFLLPLAKGEYIALCEGDDYWTDPLKLQKQADILDRDADISLCVHPARLIKTDGKEKIYAIYNKNRFADRTDIIRWKHYYWPTASFMYRKALMENYPEVCLACHVGDFPLMFYLMSKGKVYYINEVMSVYRWGVPGSHAKRSRQLDDTLQLLMRQTELPVLDAFNEWTNHAYSRYVRDKKLRLQSNMLIRRKSFKVSLYKGFYDDFRKTSLGNQCLVWLRIYIFPLLHGNFLKHRQKQP